MDQSTFEEIISILAKNGRPDLIAECHDHIKIDEDYEPPSYMKKDKYSDDEGSAEEESDYSVEEDEDGFQSLK
tara:strand:+ start:719 stop:937 length:219 start_codon:yes stop_codon:yes gene_type:complete